MKLSAFLLVTIVAAANAQQQQNNNWWNNNFLNFPFVGNGNNFFQQGQTDNRCQNPPRINGGSAQSNNFLNFFYGQTPSYTYSCEDGKVLVGNSQVTCKNGVWSDFPTCVKDNSTAKPTTTSTTTAAPAFNTFLCQSRPVRWRCATPSFKCEQFTDCVIFGGLFATSTNAFNTQAECTSACKPIPTRKPSVPVTLAPFVWRDNAPVIYDD